MNKKNFFFSLLFLSSTAFSISDADLDRNPDLDRKVKKMIEKEVKLIKKEIASERKVIFFKALSLAALLALISYGIYSSISKP